MARRVTRDRVPERKEIILWTHADKGDLLKQSLRFLDTLGQR